MNLCPVIKIRAVAKPALLSLVDRPPERTGSGVVVYVSPNRALLLSAAHVINPMYDSPNLRNNPPKLGHQYETPNYMNAAFTYIVTAPDGFEFPAKCAGRCTGAPHNGKPDLGILVIEGPSLDERLAAITLSRKEFLDSLTPLTIIGYPEGQLQIAQTFVHDGLPDVRDELKSVLTTTDQVTRAGFSGGAMIADNELVGILVAIHSFRFETGGWSKLRDEGLSNIALRAQFKLWLQDTTSSEDIKRILAGL